MGLILGNNEINRVSIGTIGEQYSLPIASSTTLGGVKINGNNLAIAADGTLSAGGGGGGKDVVLNYGNSAILYGGTKLYVQINGQEYLKLETSEYDGNNLTINGISNYGQYESFVKVIDHKYTNPTYTYRFIFKNVNSIAIKITGYEDGFAYSVNGTHHDTSSEKIAGTYKPIEITQDLNFISITNESCLHPSTLITLSDKKQVQLKDLKVGDKVLALDENGNEVEDIVDACDSQSTPKYGSKTDIWKFSDGTEIKTINPHEFYSVDEKKFKYIAEFNVGERILKQDGSTTQLISHETIEGKQQHMTLFTKRYNTYFANGILTGNRRSIKFNKEF